MYTYRPAMPGPTTSSSYLWPVAQPLIGEGSILDVGCGNGSFLGSLRRTGRDLFGCDLSVDALEIARRDNPGVRFEMLSVYDDFASAFGRRFDQIASLEVIEHLYDPHTFLTAVRRSLKPGGSFVISTPYHGWLKNVAVAALNHDRHYNPLARGGHVKFFSKRTLGSLLHRCGFCVQRILGAGRVPYLWASMVVVCTPSDGSIMPESRCPAGPETAAAKARGPAVTTAGSCDPSDS